MAKKNQDDQDQDQDSPETGPDEALLAAPPEAPQEQSNIPEGETVDERQDREFKELKAAVKFLVGVALPPSVAAEMQKHFPNMKSW